MGWQGVRLQLQIGGFIKSVLCYNLCPLLTGKRGMSAFSWAPPHCKSPQIPSSQLGTREVKIRKQIGLLANLSWEWPAREGKGRRTEEKKCLDIDRRTELEGEDLKRWCEQNREARRRRDNCDKWKEWKNGWGKVLAQQKKEKMYVHVSMHVHICFPILLVSTSVCSPPCSSHMLGDVSPAAVPSRHLFLCLELLHPTTRTNTDASSGMKTQSWKWYKSCTTITAGENQIRTGNIHTYTCTRT